MRVLVACEESQRVCTAFRERGHEAYSCDLQDCSGGHPEWHIKADALEMLKMKWDLVIAHPPCTYLSAAGAVRLFNKDHTIRDYDRYEKGLQAAEFFMAIWESGQERLCIENPVQLRVFNLPTCSQIIEPYMFGEPWRKRTCLWLKGLPPLMADDIVVPTGLWVGGTSKKRDRTIKERYELNSNRSQKIRSRTFPGIARAFSEQWG